MLTCVGQQKSEKSWLSKSGISLEKLPHPPTTTTVAPDLLIRPPHPPSVPMPATRRSSVASLRSHHSGGSSMKTKSDITEKMADPESPSTRGHKGALERRRSRSKSVVRRESVGKKNARSSQGHESVGIVLKSVKTKSDNQVTGVGLDVGEQLKSRERQDGDMVSEVGQLVSEVGCPDKLVSEVDKTSAIGGSEKGQGVDTLVSKVSCGV